MPHFLIPGNVHFKENNNFCCQEKLRELVTEPLSPHCFRCAAEVFNNTELRGPPGDPPWDFYVPPRESQKPLKKGGDFFVTKTSS